MGTGILPRVLPKDIDGKATIGLCKRAATQISSMPLETGVSGKSTEGIQLENESGFTRRGNAVDQRRAELLSRRKN